MKSTLLTVSIFAFFTVITACNNQPEPDRQSNLPLQENNRYDFVVPEFFFRTSSSQNIKMIQAFLQAPLSDSLDKKIITADSSICLLEIALNYSLDSIPKSFEPKLDSFSVKIPISKLKEEKILTNISDIKRAYEETKNYILKKKGDSLSVKVIDITATANLHDKSITYQSHIILVARQSNQHPGYNCRSYGPQTQAEWSANLSTCPLPINDAPTMLGGKLNYCSAPNSIFTMTRTVTILNAQGSTPYLYYATASGSPCNPQLNGNQLNFYYNACQTLAANNKLPGEIIINYNIWPGIIVPYTGYFIMFWNIDITYGY